MLAWPTLFPVPHHVIAKHGDSWSKPENMVYNGAFVLDKWVVNEKITARKNPKYRDAQHTVLQQVEYLALDNSVTAITAIVRERSISPGFRRSKFPPLKNHCLASYELSRV